MMKWERRFCARVEELIPKFEKRGMDADQARALAVRQTMREHGQSRVAEKSLRMAHFPHLSRCARSAETANKCDGYGRF
jgi:hypothetical protein